MRVPPAELEHNRELLVVAYLAAPSPRLLAEILSAFEPICRSHARHWLRAIGLHSVHKAEDLEQEARLRAIELLGSYKPRGGSFQRLLILAIRQHFLDRRRRVKRERERFGPMPERGL